MFTGLIKEVGSVVAVERTEAGARLRIDAALARELREGDSVAVDGACLTAAAVAESWFAADVMNQTLSVTTLGELAPGARVNLEPPLRAGEPLGGHLVQGHVDCRARLLEARADGFARRLRFELPSEQRRLVVEHGSVTVAGVSLTVAALADEAFEVSLIPETLARTNLGELEAAGSPVNIELDVIARYVDRLLHLRFEREGSK